ncbi:ABC transporter ATP-binding protein [Natronomonas salina]|uniref:ABC transporter ATP-binding protein n=1 Tax=Natronomonas salina TaxID=1710540 RepID=UPI0015B6E78D|nr:ABC transporter ATP-binding protein [Natronomonas salina]QLD88207.1 ABC transporter ATP-binding protein [Natronomonas salina]
MSTGPPAAVEFDSVTKQYDGVTALRNLSLTVQQGEIYGFLGPNGAGKSTSIGLALDFVRPTNGSVTVLGHDAQAASLQVRERVGFLSDDFEVYDRLTGRQHVSFAIEAKGADDDPAALLDRVGLEEAADRAAGGYSKGMKQRLGLATALVGDADLLILDEPSTGLDPNAAREMREIIRAENERGATVFFSSHILEQVDAICDRVGILRSGELVAEDTVDGLRETVGGDSQLRLTVDTVPDGLLEAVRNVSGVSDVSLDAGDVVAVCRPDARRDVIDAVESTGATVEQFETEEISLEAMFAAYTEGGA